MPSTTHHPSHQWLKKAIVAPRLAEQEALFTAAIRADSYYALAWYGRGSLHLGQHRFAAAIADLSVALSLNPRLTHAWDERAYAHLRLGQTSRAIADFRQALYLDPANAAARRYLTQLTRP